MLLNNVWVNKEIQKEVKKLLETNKIVPNLWDSLETALRRKFIAMQTYLKKIKKSQTT